jgi:hypothetical protein
MGIGIPMSHNKTPFTVALPDVPRTKPIARHVGSNLGQGSSAASAAFELQKQRGMVEIAATEPVAKVDIPGINLSRQRHIESD